MKYVYDHVQSRICACQCLKSIKYSRTRGHENIADGLHTIDMLPIPSNPHSILGSVNKTNMLEEILDCLSVVIVNLFKIRSD
jgi:hypothetical protein